MFSRVVVVLLVAAVLVTDGAHYTRTVTYDGEIVVRCNKEGRGVTAFLQNDFVDVWQFRSDGTVDVRVSKDRFDGLVPAPECTLLISDVEAYVRQVENVTTAPAAEWNDAYHRYADIVKWYEDLATDNPDIVKFNPSIGKSYEGRDMPAVTISKAEEPDKVIYSQCQIHAREWISGATCMYLANKLVEVIKAGDPDKSIPEEVKFVFVPLVNPDGYEYTWTNSRLWRKNRRKGTLCDGVDLNRNYNDHWNQGGSSGNECSETYHGRSADSELETQNTVNYFKSIGNIVGAIDWHSYSQLILRPYGWTRNDCPDEEQLKALGDTMSTEIQKVHGMSYTSQKSVDLYITTGTASDWFYSANANEENQYRAAGFTIELRDTGRYGFELPPNQIIPTGEEMYPALLKFAEELSANPLKK